MIPLDCQACAASWKDGQEKCPKCGGTIAVPRFPPPRLFPEVKAARPHDAPKIDSTWNKKKTPKEPTARLI